MRLLVCLVTYQRLAYTKRTIRSLIDSTSDTADYFLVVVDNGSTDGTQKYLEGLDYRGRINILILNETNLYPGNACNIGWQRSLELYDATHLMRLDNDMQLTKGWDKRVEAYFQAIPELGQLGVEHEAIETPEAELHKRVINGMTINEWPGVVGGPMVMPRKVWDKGIRYDVTPWHKIKSNVPAMQEDSKLSQAIKAKGYLVGHAQEELGRTFANKNTWHEHIDYYIKTMETRGYDGNAEYLRELKKDL